MSDPASVTTKPDSGDRPEHLDPESTADDPHGTSAILVLASGSRFRARVLAEAGIPVRIEEPRVDERALDNHLASTAIEDHALMLAEAKARCVLERLRSGPELGQGPHGGRTGTVGSGDMTRTFIIGADQLGVVGEGADQMILHKRSTAAGAVDQLMSMSATTHRLINGLVVVAGGTGAVVRGIDVMTVTMRPFTRQEAVAYVERFEPFDSAGSYRIEDQDELGADERFVTAVEGEDPRGVLGMPVPLLERLLETIGARSVRR